MTPRAVAQLGGPPLAALAVWFGLGWLTPALSGDDGRLAQVEAARDGLVVEVAAARALPAAADRADQRLSTAAAAVPTEPGISEFVRLVGQLATAQGVVVDQISPLTVSSDTDAEATTHLPPGTSSITLSIGTRGRYEALMDFLDALRHQPRLVLVDLIDLTADENDASGLVADLEVRVFTTEALVRPPAAEDSGAVDTAAVDPAAGDTANVDTAAQAGPEASP